MSTPEPSTYSSRNFFSDREQELSTFPILGQRSFTFDPPARFKRGWYRVELDFATHRATAALISLDPEEAS